MFRTGRLVVFLILGLFLAALLPAFAADSRPLVAILDFDDGSISDRWWSDNDWHPGKGITGIIVSELMKTKRFRLIERQRIDEILKEQDFGAGGRVNKTTAADIGKILGVQYVIFGDVTEFSIKKKGAIISILAVEQSTAKVKIDGRFVDTTNAEILATATGEGEAKEGKGGIWTGIGLIAFGSADFEKTILGKATRQAVTDFCGKIVSEADNAGIAGIAPGVPTAIPGKVAAVTSSKVYLNVGAADGVTIGMVFVIERIVQEVKDPDTGALLDVITEPICEITISEQPKEHSCNGSITAYLGSGQPQMGDQARQKI